MEGLFSPTDPDLAAYRELSPDYFLRVASDYIRTYLGWHLAPNIDQTSIVEVGGRGIAMLPSRYVTDLYKVSFVSTSNVVSEEPVDPGAYYWDALGYIQFNSYRHPLIGQRLQVEFQHGYDAVPLDVKSVAYELVSTSQEAPAGNVKGMSTPGGYRLELSQPYGFNFNADQTRRLSAYKLGWAI
jgi:hypothetical protein